MICLNDRGIIHTMMNKVVRLDCSDQLSRDEVTSLTYSSPLRVNVSASANFFQVYYRISRN